MKTVFYHIFLMIYFIYRLVIQRLKNFFFNQSELKKKKSFTTRSTSLQQLWKV